MLINQQKLKNSAFLKSVKKLANTIEINNKNLQ